MPFQLSPGVNVSEIDLTTVVPAVATTTGAIGGVFRWGPVDKHLLITSEDQLAVRYGKPTNFNAETWFTAASFLAYSNTLYVSRSYNEVGDMVEVTGLTFNTATNVVAIADTSGISLGDRVFGIGIADDAYVTAIDEDTNVTLSTAPSVAATGTGVLQFAPSSITMNAFANTAAADANLQIVKNEDHYDSAVLSFEDSVHFVAKYPGAIGNSLKISVCPTASGFKQTLTLTDSTLLSTGGTGTNTAGSEGITLTIGSNTAVVTFANSDANASLTSADAETTGELQSILDAAIDGFLSVGDLVKVGNTRVGFQTLTVSAIDAAASANSTIGRSTKTIHFEEEYATNYTGSTATLQSFDRTWQYADNFDRAPGQSPWQETNGSNVDDELHVIVIDEDGQFTGVRGTILEIFEGLSRSTNSKTEDGGTNYYKDVINQNSQYVWFANDLSGAESSQGATLAAVTGTYSNIAWYGSFTCGTDGADETDVALGDILTAYDRFAAEDVDVSLIIAGKARGGTNGEALGNYLVDNVAEKRKDCVVFISPDKADVVNNAGNDQEADVVTFRNSCRNTSYAVLDSGYKYMYDKYNDIYRWTPLNGDIAGLCAATDTARDPWFSPAGLNRGQIKNIIKLAWSPNKAQRDELYKNGVNPVVNFRGQGIVLYGDKTLLSRPSAFDRINVRRLFIVIEKAIARASRSTLFEFNDEFTRAAFVSLIEPYLRTVQGRRGIQDFAIVCDETNNTSQVIDSNEFVGDIYIKPNRSINFIQLNFVAVRSGVEFSEIITNG